mmetsp:Transcript_19052/g.39841  ORF Transcript_19052/g.39841 Transcript_19052/m.39841 type:complete len:304 (+) Transcript_19052:182-1093(+)
MMGSHSHSHMADHARLRPQIAPSAPAAPAAASASASAAAPAGPAMVVVPTVAKPAPRLAVRPARVGQLHDQLVLGPFQGARLMQGLDGRRRRLRRRVGREGAPLVHAVQPLLVDEEVLQLSVGLEQRAERLHPHRRWHLPDEQLPPLVAARALLPLLLPLGLLLLLLLRGVVFPLRLGEAHHEVPPLAFHELLPVQPFDCRFGFLHRGEEHHGAAPAVPAPVPQHLHLNHPAKPRQVLPERLLVQELVDLSEEELRLRAGRTRGVGGSVLPFLLPGVRGRRRARRQGALPPGPRPVLYRLRLT